MGIIASRILAKLGARETRLFLLGLDGAGKTTILFKLKFGEVGTTLPTIGFNVETIQYKNISFIIWDVGGGNKIRPIYKHYFQRTHALIHVVDSNDSDRVEETAELLHEMLLHDELRDAVVLILANKQDLPHALNPTQLREKLRLNSVKQPWHIQASCAISADGLYEGLDWLATKLSTQGRK